MKIKNNLNVFRFKDFEKLVKVSEFQAMLALYVEHGQERIFMRCESDQEEKEFTGAFDFLKSKLA